MVGILFLTFIGLTGIFAVIKKNEKERRGMIFLFVLLFALLANTLLCVAMGKGNVKHAYFSGLFPLFIVCLAFYVKQISDVIRQKTNFKFTLPVLLIALTLIWAMPLKETLTLEGRPTAYKSIVKHINETSPPGTLVLVDRWLEPWNELTLYPLADGRKWVFTVPNEPATTAHQFNWQKSVEDFFNRFPNAVYVSFLDSYRNPELGAYFIGEWDWPERYFADRTEVRHEAGIRLTKWGYAVREDFYDESSTRLAVPVYRNALTDIQNKAIAEGKKGICLFGAGWDYIKAWQDQPGIDPRMIANIWIQAGFFSEHGIPATRNELERAPQQIISSLINNGRFTVFMGTGESSTLDLYNLTDEPINFDLLLTGFATGSSSTCKVGNTYLTYSIMLEQKSVPLTLDSGHTPIVISQSRNATPISI
ncbi:MAG: hypothetical protein GX811_07550 [Lentisphaerae bacterium]|nr:hypothetical protein [Lentisphaerota bacterium]